MSQRRLLMGLSGVAAAALTLTAFSPAAFADSGRGDGTEKRAAAQFSAQLVDGTLAAEEFNSGTAFEMPKSYPHQEQLNFYRDNLTGPNGEADYNTKVPNLLSHPDLAPRLTDLMEKSNRVSVQVVGQSTQGRDLYLVTVTAPETESFTAQQTA